MEPGVFVEVPRVVGVEVLEVVDSVVLGVTKFVGLNVAVIVVAIPGIVALETDVTWPPLHVNGNVTGVCAAAALEHKTSRPCLAMLTKSSRVMEMGVLVVAQFWRMSQ